MELLEDDLLGDLLEGVAAMPTFETPLANFVDAHCGGGGAAADSAALHAEFAALATGLLRRHLGDIGCPVGDGDAGRAAVVRCARLAAALAADGGGGAALARLRDALAAAASAERFSELLATRNAEIESEIGAIVIRPSAATPAAAAVTAVDGGSPRLQPSQQLQRADATSDAADATQPIAASKALQRVMHECIAEFFAREGGSGGGGVSSSTGSGAAAAGAGLTSQERHDIRRAIIASLIDEETRRARLSSRELSELEAALAASLLDAAVAAASASASSQEGDGEGARGGTAALMPQRSTLTTASSTPQARSGASSGSGTLASSVRRLAGGIMRLRVGKPKPAAPAAAAPMGTVAAVPANDSVATAPPQSQPPPPAAAAAGSADRGETVDGVRGITPATTTAADGDDSRPPSSSPHAAADAARRPLGATNTPSFTTSSFKPVLTAARRVPPLLPVLPPLGEPLPPLATTAREGDMNGRADRKASAESDDGDDDGGVSPSALAAAEVAARAAHLRQQRDLLLAKKAAERQRALDEFQGRRRALAAQQQLPRHAADGSGSGGGGAGGTPNPLRAAVARL